MNTLLTHGQKALLEARLVQRQHQLDRRLAEHLGGLSRAEHAREVLASQNGEAFSQGGDRASDLALADLETSDLGSVSEALRRLASDDFGCCIDCGGTIAFDRLKAEPWALRCLACQTAHEERSR